MTSDKANTGMTDDSGKVSLNSGSVEGFNVNLVSSLIEQNDGLTSKLTVVDAETTEKKSKLEDLKIETENLKAKLTDLDRESEELEESTNAKCKDDRISEEIQNLLITYERLKSDEKQFKEQCKSELEKLQSLASQSDDSQTVQGDIEAQLQRARSRLEAGKVELGAVNRKLALLQRQVEQIPNRTELREYRLRFAELYNQVSATHRQTKQFFSLYNSLEDTKRYLEKELSLLNSIVDSYHQVSSTAAGRAEFLNQLSALHAGMKDTCGKVDKRHQTERLSVEKLQHELQRLLDQKVAYEKCLKELEAECKNNDKLLSTLKKKESTHKE